MERNARAALLRWFDANARDLPWRRTRDPYAIWVSEVMLQQTRVETVKRYYDRFLARFPTPEALARAHEDEVLAMWSGLGYYRRARLLHRGVAEAIARYGEVPRDASARRALPGVGAYTAGAIGSIAFDLPEPIVDGNVARVLSRVHRIATPLGEARTDKQLWARAAEWAAGERPGALNQALMELGATVCVPTNPSCDACPLASACGAREHGEVLTLPIPKAKAAPRPVELAAAVLVDAEGRLLLLRSDQALFFGLHGCPTSEAGLDGLRARVAALVVGLVLEHEPVAEVTHVLTHRRLSVAVYRGRFVAPIEPPSADVRLLARTSLDTVGVSKLTRKLLDAADEAPASLPTRTPRAAGRSRTSARGRAAAGADAGRSPASPSSPAKRRTRAGRAS